MARKDEIFNKFLEHEIIINKYNVSEADIPQNIREAESSQIPIIRVIAMIVNELENGGGNKKQLRSQIHQYLNQANTNI